MVYFSDTCKPVTDDTTTVAAAWIERIDGEYREMPGLRLTVAQAARLWGLQAPQCRALLGALVERGRLVETPDGRYGVVGGLTSGPS
jgi:predicted transcriptional regulator of viral defense system